MVKAVHHLESTFFGPQRPGKLGPRGWLGWFPTIYPSKHLEISPSWTIPCCSCPKRRYESLIWSQTWTTKGMRTVFFFNASLRGGGVVSRFFWGWPNKFFLAGFLGWNMMKPKDLEVTMGLVIFRDKTWHLTPTQRSVERDSSDSLMWMIFQRWFPEILFSQDKYMWVGRVWELRALLMHQSNDKVQTITTDSEQLSEFRKRELKAKLKDPELRPRLKRLAARWGRVKGT